jgi:hypothetical protein
MPVGNIAIRQISLRFPLTGKTIFLEKSRFFLTRESGFFYFSIMPRNPLLDDRGYFFCRKCSNSGERAMALIEVLKWDTAPKVFAYKYPNAALFSYWKKGVQSEGG